MALAEILAGMGYLMTIVNSYCILLYVTERQTIRSVSYVLVNIIRYIELYPENEGGKQHLPLGPGFIGK